MLIFTPSSHNETRLSAVLRSCMSGITQSVGWNIRSGEESSPWERFHCPICIVMPPWRRGQRDTFLILLLTTDDISLAPGLSSYFGWYVKKKGTDNRMRQIGLFRVHLPYIICGRVAHRHRGRYYESFVANAQPDHNSTWRYRKGPERGIRWDEWFIWSNIWPGPLFFVWWSDLKSELVSGLVSLSELCFCLV